jgi:hypothetical protein
MSAPAPQTERRRFSLVHLLLLLPWIALVIDAWAPIGDNSFLWHIRAGELQIEAGSVLVADPFSFTRLGAEWLTQSWLADILYAWLESYTGLGFVPPMLLITSSLTFIGIGLIAYRANPNPAATSIVLILATLSFISFLVPRPVIFSYLLFVLVILAWERPHIRWLIPFLFWLWASVHGSFFIGLAYVGLRLIGRKEWKALPAAVAGGVAVLLTAHGFGVVQMLLDFFAARPYLSLLTEWRSPELLSPVFFPVFVALALILIGAALGRVPASRLWVVIPFLALALTATRSVPPALLALVTATAISIGSFGSRLPRRFGTGPAAVVALVVFVLPFLLIGDAGLSDERFPVEAVRALDGSNTFHDDVVGGYLIWSEGPERLVYIDDRAELYQEQMEEFVAIRSGREDWRPAFEEFDIQQAILRQGEPIVEWLGDGGWVEVHSDDEFIVLRAN